MKNQNQYALYAVEIGDVFVCGFRGESAPRKIYVSEDYPLVLIPSSEFHAEGMAAAMVQARAINEKVVVLQ